MSITDLENAIYNLEQILIQLQKQSLNFFPEEEFVAVDAESTVIAGTLQDAKMSKLTAEFNVGIVGLKLQLELLENRLRHLEQLFIKDPNAQVEEAITSAHLDILHTKKEIHDRRLQDVNIILDEKTNNILEKYQLL